LVFLAGKKGSFIGEPKSSDDMILNEASEWLPGSGHEILVVGVGDIHCLGTGELAL